MHEHPTLRSSSDQAPFGSRTILLSVSRELCKAAGMLVGVQEALCNADLSLLTTSDAIKLQQLDLVEQTLRALSSIVGCASSDQAKLDDSLSECSLSTLAARLKGHAPEPGCPVEFF